MPVGRDTQEPDLANPAPGTRRKKGSKRNSMTIDQMRTYVAQEQVTWKKVVQAAKIAAD